MWDRTSLEHSMPFNAWGKGNGTANKNTGNMPSAPAGAWQNCVFTNCGVGSGYIYNGGDAHYNSDSVNDAIVLNKILSWTDALKKTFEIKLNYDWDNTIQVLFGDYKVGAANYILCWVNPANRKIFLNIVKGGVLRAVESTDAVSDGDHTIHFVKDGATMKFYLDGVEVSYDAQDAYNLGNMTDSNALIYGNAHTFTWALFGRTEIWNVYSDAISQARITANHALGKDMGEIADNVGDVMSFREGGPMPLFAKNLIQRG